MEDILNAGLEGYIGSGMADKAGKALSGRELQLKQQECNALGMEYDQKTGSCRRVSNSEPTLDQ